MRLAVDPFSLVDRSSDDSLSLGMENEPIEERFFSTISDEEIARERRKAKELKNSAWWKNKRSSGICHYCGQKFKVEELTMDHLIPIIRGGLSIKANLVPSCKDCNSKKKHSLPFEKDFYK